MNQYEKRQSKATGQWKVETIKCWGCATGRGGGHSLKGHSHPVLQLLSVSLKDLCATHQNSLIGFELRAQNNRRLKAKVHLKN